MQRTVTVRTVLSLIALCCIAIVIAFQCGTFDYFVKNRIQALSQREETEWRNQWFGVNILQYPTDLMLYQELIHAVKPDVVIETGTDWGGNAIYLATILESVNPKGKIVTIDIDSTHWKKTLATFNVEGKDKILNRIVFLEGDAASPEIVQQVKNHVNKDAKVLLILDSLHTKEQVLAELNLYADFVSPNSYVIVNDTQLEGWYPSENKSQPLSAIKEFLQKNDHFVVDKTMNRFYVSCAPSGFLKRVK